ncbi:hypothetical protein BpHYR1_053055 [Brachionus plicatilis]|uniref:Uncharacterized protein n=1 Tax=Brachionus plicatilis TaxID=10195 RepID=A0A3M7T075_BRAPC|nr:hypothetical protein BpHYR1_053055 [Brachionus plicatilis]
MNYSQLSLIRPISEINNVRLFIIFINEKINSFRYKMSVVLAILYTSFYNAFYKKGKGKIIRQSKDPNNED